MIEGLTITEAPAGPEAAGELDSYRRNSDWLGAHDAAFFEPFRGRYVAAAGGEIFVSGDAWEAQRLAKAKYPDDQPFVAFIPREKLLRIYAC